MRSRLLPFLLVSASAVAVSLVATPARAQVADQLTFRTGFPFVVGNRVLPPGRYLIERVWDNPFLFEVSGPKTALMEVHYAGAAPAIGSGHDEVLFRRYGKDLVMNEVWDADSASGVLLAVRYRGEPEARNETTPVIPVAASRTAGAR